MWLICSPCFLTINIHGLTGLNVSRCDWRTCAVNYSYIILATVIYYKTAALASAAEKSTLALTPLETHFTLNKWTVFLWQSVYRAMFCPLNCYWSGLDLHNLDLFCKTLHLGSPLPRSPPIGAFPTFSSTSLPALVQREAIIFPPRCSFSQFVEWSVIFLHKRLAINQCIRGPI